MTGSLTHRPSGEVLAERVRLARSVSARIRGLIGSALRDGEALVLQPAKQVHTFFMSGPIDVVFCDEHWNVLHVVSPMQPWRLGKWVRGARYAIEMLPGAARVVRPGDTLELVERPVGA